MLLQGRLSIHPDIAEISLSDLIQIVANKLLETSQASAYSDEYTRLRQQEQLEGVIDLLPRLQFGLDVNVMFGGVTKFEFTQELSAFDAFDIPLYHGWIVDQSDNHAYNLLKNLSYNHVQFKLVEYRSRSSDQRDRASSEDVNPAKFSGSEADKAEGHDDNTRALSEGGVAATARNELQSESKAPEGLPVSGQDGAEEADAVVMETFLRDSAAQLTVAGLFQLHETLREHELAVFFRNNHFNTLFRHRDKLYLLVTDLGYIHEPVVWELLGDIKG